MLLRNHDFNEFIGKMFALLCHKNKHTGYQSKTTTCINLILTNKLNLLKFFNNLKQIFLFFTKLNQF